jgi:hypothetical protein
MDKNSNGVIDIGDVFNTETLAPSFTVSSDVTGKDLTLAAADALARVMTGHYKSVSYEGYNLNVEVMDGGKMPVKVTISAGPNIAVPIDMANDGWGHMAWLGINARPAVNDTYTLDVTYSDGSSGTLSPQVTGVLDSFATLTYPTGADNGNGDTAPTFTWTAPVSHPTAYGYRIMVFQNGSDQLWQYPQDNNMPSSQLSVPFNTDGSASSGALTPGVQYSWGITVNDEVTRNSSTYNVDFTP